jgi:putative hydrolase of the HAD superfamily
LRRHGLCAARCILVEDTLVNLKHAKRIGLRTAWVTQYVRGPLPRTAKRPAYVDVKVKSVLQLPRRLNRLR